MLTKKQYQEIKDNLDGCKNPLFFFDDDQDGLCSFLLLYKYKNEGKGFIVKTSPKIDESFVRHVNNYNPDKVFILDIAIVEQEFLDEVKVPVIWVDHHNPLERDRVKYFNPRVNGDSLPTTYLAYKTVNENLWLAMTGCVADYHIPDFAKEFEKKYPDLIDRKYKNPGDILYGGTKLGKLIRIFSFILKGKNEDVKKSLKIMTRIESPYEMLNQETSQAKYLYKRYEIFNKKYEILYNDVKEQAEKTKEKLVVYRYKDDVTSFTADLGNEISYNFPEKIILIARKKNNEMKCSLRSKKTVLPGLIEKSLDGLRGYGGGHELACGLNVDVDDFEEFLRRFNEMI
tara:strand:+ start:27232 stop:28260 length:1029 start_codon:yes stop_codon:yes gene_type:complete